MYTYGGFMLRFDRKQNSVKQLSFNKKINLKNKATKKKIAGRNINNLRYAENITLMAESKEELKTLLNVKESEKLA